MFMWMRATGKMLKSLLGNDILKQENRLLIFEPLFLITLQN
jgi:hypothetical protein